MLAMLADPFRETPSHSARNLYHDVRSRPQADVKKARMQRKNERDPRGYTIEFKSPWRHALGTRRRDGRLTIYKPALVADRRKPTGLAHPNRG